MQNEINNTKDTYQYYTVKSAHYPAAAALIETCDRHNK